MEPSCYKPLQIVGYQSTPFSTVLTFACTRPRMRLVVHFLRFWFFKAKIFSDILERNNNYSDTLAFRRGWVGEVTLFVMEVVDYKSAMLIYLCIHTHTHTHTHTHKVAIQVTVSNQFSWNSHGWCGSTHVWTLLILKTIGPIEAQIWGENMSPKLVLRV